MHLSSQGSFVTHLKIDLGLFISTPISQYMILVDPWCVLEFETYQLVEFFFFFNPASFVTKLLFRKRQLALQRIVWCELYSRIQKCEQANEKR